MQNRIDTSQEPVAQKTESLRVTIELLQDKNQELQAQVYIFIQSDYSFVIVKKNANMLNTFDTIS